MSAAVQALSSVLKTVTVQVDAQQSSAGTEGMWGLSAIFLIQRCVHSTLSTMYDNTLYHILYTCCTICCIVDCLRLMIDELTV